MQNVFDQWLAYLGFLPEILIALIVLLIGWLIAKGIAKAVKKALNKTSLDDKLFEKMNINTKKYSSEDVISKIVFWILMLVVIVIFLNMLNLGGAVGPFTTLLSTIFSYIPNILGAAIILAIGWIVARLVKGLVVGLLKKAGTERLSEKIGLSKVLEGTTLSNIIGTIVYVLILIPVVITALETLELQGIAAPAIAMLNSIMTMIPNIIVAVILIAAGVWLGKWVKKIVSGLLKSVGLNSFFSSLGLGARARTANTLTPSDIVGYAAQVIVVLLFTIEALQLVNLHNIVGIVNAILAYLPMVIGALLVLGIGLYVANLAQKFVSSMIVQRSEAKLFGNLAKYIIIIFTVFMAIDQLQIANTVVNSAFMLILGALALAFGLAFGLGGRDFASRRLAKLEEKMEKTQTKQPDKEGVKEDAKPDEFSKPDSDQADLTPPTGESEGKQSGGNKNRGHNRTPADDAEMYKPGDAKDLGDDHDNFGPGKGGPRR